MNNIVGIIPARGGSKGIPRKNIRKLAGKQLLTYTAEAAFGSKLLNRIILSTEDEEIKQLGLQLGLDVPFVRPANLAEDNTPGLSVIQHAVRTLEIEENYHSDVIVVLQPTSPLRTSQHIDEALKKFLRDNADSLVSVTEIAHNLNPYSVMRLKANGTLEPFLKYDEKKNIRQLKPVFYARNGAAIYICTYDCLMKKNSLFGDKLLPFFMKKEESFDLDDQIDWEIVESLLNNKIDQI
jgi:CMP-N,N'-diacetyllegionaminic acid synthase